MKKAITISIPEPCHEDWSHMTPQEKGRHCDVCDKVVVDFTKFTDEQLVKQFQKESKLCGRFMNNQLEREITLSRKRINPLLDYAASVLIPAAIFTTSNVAAQQQPPMKSTYKSLQMGALHRERPPLFDPFAYRAIGMVTAQGQPLQGATVSVKGTDRSTLTNEKGEFYLEALPSDRKLFVTHDAIGEKTVQLLGYSGKYQIEMEGVLPRILKGLIMADGQPLPGANIIVKGTSRGTQADFDGSFELAVNKEDILVISLIGYETKTIEVNDQKNIDITLHGAMIMGEMVIMGRMNVQGN